MITEEMMVPDDWYKNISYKDAKVILTEKLQNMSLNLVATGYYMKYIRDNELYKEDGYASIWEFAEDTYGIKRTTASRWMAINDKFSKDGNSPILDEPYRGYNRSQLQELLYLDDTQMEQVTPDMTVKEIREVRKPVVEEPVQPVENERSGKKCVTGLSGSGVCGSAQYCSEPVECCMSCDKDCNGRCGWIKDEPELHDEKWFVNQIYKNDIVDIRAAIKICFEELQTDKHMAVGDVAKRIQKKVSPYGCACWSGAGYKIDFMNYSNGVEIGIGDERKRITYYRFTSILLEMINDGAIQNEDECATSHTEEQIPGRMHIEKDFPQYCPEPIERIEEEHVLLEELEQEDDYVVTEEDIIDDEHPDGGDVIEGEAVVLSEEDLEETVVAIEPIMTELQMAREELLKEQRNLKLTQATCEPNSKHILRYKVRIAALANFVIEVEELEEQKLLQKAQPELPQFKNDDQRKDWLRNYKDWGLWYEDNNIGCRYYKYDFDNGARLIIQVYTREWGKWEPDYEDSYFHLFGGPNPTKGKPAPIVPLWTYHENYSRYPNSISELVEFLKYIQKEKRETPKGQQDTNGFRFIEEDV